MSLTTIALLALAAVAGYLVGVLRYAGSRRSWIELAEELRRREAQQRDWPYKRLWPKGREPL